MIVDEMIHGSWTGLRSARPKTHSKRRRQITPLPPRPAAIQPIAPSLSAVPGRRRPAGVRIDWDIPIVAWAVAEGVCEEASVWLQSPLPRRWIRELVAHANTVYARNERFRRRLRAGDCRGRDFLWTFMRHWLAAMLKERRHHLFLQLPASYGIGRTLEHWVSPAGTRQSSVGVRMFA